MSKRNRPTVAVTNPTPAHPSWCLPAECGCGEHEGTPHTATVNHGHLTAYLTQRHADGAAPIVNLLAADRPGGEGVFLELSLGQAAQLADLLAGLIAEATGTKLPSNDIRQVYAAGYVDGLSNREPDDREVMEAFRLGQEVERISYDAALARVVAEAAKTKVLVNRAAAGTTVADLKGEDRAPVNPRRKAAATDCKPTGTTRVTSRIPAARVASL